MWTRRFEGDRTKTLKSAGSPFQARVPSQRPLYDLEQLECRTLFSATLVADLTPGFLGSNPSQLTNVNGTLYFLDNGSVWKTDGTPTGTLIVHADTTGNGQIEDLTPFGNRLAFTEVNFDITHFTRQLWVTDGTSVGTHEIADITDRGLVSTFEPIAITQFNGRLFFAGESSAAGVELWSSDGTTAGTGILKNINPITSSDVAGNSSFPSNFMSIGNELYFTANDGTNGYQLWKTDGTTTGTMLVAVINTNLLFGTTSDPPSDLVNFNGSLFFHAGGEVWTSDGTSLGTFAVSQIVTGAAAFAGADPLELTAIGNSLFFSATDQDQGAAVGDELWKTDGTTSGTVLVKDIAPGTLNGSTLNGGPQSLTNVNGILYFSANSVVSGRELWRSDGTDAGTTMVLDINAAGGSDPQGLTAIGGTLFFTADDGIHGRELWESDGTPSGTTMVQDINLGISTSSPLHLTAVGKTLFFSAIDSTTGDELWETAPPGIESPIYRLFSPVTKEHLFTLDLNEYNTLGGQGWIQEGSPFQEYSGPITIGGVSAIPIYRLYDKVNRQHLWTTDANEYGTLRQFTSWSAEGIASYTFSVQVAGSIPLYRLSYPFLADLHQWTTDSNEYAVLHSTYGWVQENAIGYVFP